MVAEAITGAETFADIFEANHRLTFDQPSIDDGTASATARIMTRSTDRIIFNTNIPADIPDDETLVRVNSLLPYSQRNLLTSASEVAEIIDQRPNNKSSGDDEMPYYILKRIDPEIYRFLAKFFNHLIANAYFPRHWRHARMTPIPKPGKDHSIITNWRPISQLICISKIYERVIANRFLQFDQNDRIFPDQFGFLREHSSEHALAKLQADIINGINAGKVTDYHHSARSTRRFRYHLARWACAPNDNLGHE